MDEAVDEAISHIARGIGDRKEIKLFHRWCGKPTTTMLRFAAKRPDNPCTPRNAQILHLLNEAPPATNIEHLITKRGGPEFPDEAVDEAAVKIHNRDARADKLDSLYEPVVAWMRENSRENQLVFEEEISYGFQRNFFALKRFALGCGVVSFYVEAKWVHLWWQKSWPYHTPIANPIDTAVLIAIFAYLVGVLLFVSENSVKVQGFIYARQLLNSFYGTASSDQPADGKGGHGKPS